MSQNNCFIGFCEKRNASVQQAVWRERRCSPQKPLCNFAGFAPARTSVSRLPRQAAATLSASGGQRSGNKAKKI